MRQSGVIRNKTPIRGFATSASWLGGEKRTPWPNPLSAISQPVHPWSWHRDQGAARNIRYSEAYLEQHSPIGPEDIFVRLVSASEVEDVIAVCSKDRCTGAE
jgi:hypothetical protein